MTLSLGALIQGSTPFPCLVYEFSFFLLLFMFFLPCGHGFVLLNFQSKKPVSDNPTMMTTMLNTKSEIALPGYLVIDPTRQLRVEDHVAVGGGGAVYVATLTDPTLKEENGGNDKVIVKEVHPVDQLTKEENALLFKQEVAAMG